MLCSHPVNPLTVISLSLGVFPPRKVADHVQRPPPGRRAAADRNDAKVVCHSLWHISQITQLPKLPLISLLCLHNFLVDIEWTLYVKVIACTFSHLIRSFFARRNW